MNNLLIHVKFLIQEIRKIFDNKARDILVEKKPMRKEQWDTI